MINTMGPLQPACFQSYLSQRAFGKLMRPVGLLHTMYKVSGARVALITHSGPRTHCQRKQVKIPGPQKQFEKLT